MGAPDRSGRSTAFRDSRDACARAGRNPYRARVPPCGPWGWDGAHQAGEIRGGFGRDAQFVPDGRPQIFGQPKSGVQQGVQHDLVRALEADHLKCLGHRFDLAHAHDAVGRAQHRGGERRILLDHLGELGEVGHIRLGLAGNRREHVGRRGDVELSGFGEVRRRGIHGIGPRSGGWNHAKDASIP